MDISTIIDNISDDDNLRTLTFKKSILVERTGDETPELKRDNSKAQIQWKEVPEKSEDERKVASTSFPALGILTSRGFKWHYIHDAMLKIRVEEIKQAKRSDEDIQVAHRKVFKSLMQDLGSSVLQNRYNKNAELTLDQQTHLEILKHKVKAENDTYLRRHPEIDIMVKLVYATLFKNQPPSPALFVSDYVHHLNKHREEIVVEDVDIPFDRPQVPEEVTSEEEEQRQIREFARQIVESCINLAALGESYVDVMGIINSMLRIVSPSEDKISIESSISNAEVAVSEVLLSLLTSVAIERSTSAELVADELLDIILSHALPYVQRDSEVYLEMKGSVENFIRDLLDQLTDKVLSKDFLREVMEEAETKGEELSGEEKGRSILRKELSSTQEDDHLKNKTKVKFQSLM